jgi:hypothetical protein
VAATYRTDVSPWQLVAWYRTGREEWQTMITAVCDQASLYGGLLVHDATGLGAVVEDSLGTSNGGTLTSLPIKLTGALRSAIFSEYVKALEDDEIRHPRIQYAYQEHLYCEVKDLHGAGHPPDSVVASALAWHGRSQQSAGQIEVQVVRHGLRGGDRGLRVPEGF